MQPGLCDMQTPFERKQQSLSGLFLQTIKKGAHLDSTMPAAYADLASEACILCIFTRNQTSCLPSLHLAHPERSASPL